MTTREQTYSSPDSYEAVVTRALTRVYTLNWERIAYAVILVLALLTRFVDLGARVMSHDESLHTYYSWRLYEYGEFEHTPLMHGPVLFHMVALSYFLFGDNDFTARIYPALLGVLLVMFPILFRRWLGRVGAVVASVLLLISPMVMYYNRYIREDTPSVFYTLVFAYAAIQYVNGERPRRPIWLMVMSAGLLLSLASKEVAFIYIIIVFAPFLVLYWVMRMMQDIGVRRRPANLLTWQEPPLQLLAGHVILLGLVCVVVVLLGTLVRQLYSTVLWLPSAMWVQVPLFLDLYLSLVAMGTAGAIMRGLSDGRSALQVILAGIIIGAILALVIVCILDVIKPAEVWKTSVVMGTYDQMHGTDSTKEYAVEVQLDDNLFIRLLTWIGVPALAILFVLFMTVVFSVPAQYPLPWDKLLLIILIALITTGGLVAFERRSYVAQSDQTPFAANPTEASKAVEGQYDQTPLRAAWLIGSAVLIFVLATRLLTNWWDFFNRQPVFDVLIVIGTLVLPWLSAFPLYWAGYNLEEYNPGTAIGRDTLNAAFTTFIPFALVAVAIGLAWNWRRWIPAAAIFLGLFGFFYTTVFSNANGLATGMVGSLGYWLEQQGVRRGSQPQYYYVLTQLPVYEFLPVIGALCAGIMGLSLLWRRYQHHRTLPGEDTAWDAGGSAEQPGAEMGAAGSEIVLPSDETLVSAMSRAQETTLPAPSFDESEAGEESASVVRYAGVIPRLYRPFDFEEEQRRRTRDPEWVGELPFLGMVGYWGIMILFALTTAGEKMPWLTIHLTVPLILLTGWWLGRVITGIRWSELKDGGWLLLLVAIPLAFLGLSQAVLLLWGSRAPFQGRSPQELGYSGNWMAAVLLTLGALYLIGRIGGRLGVGQLGRMVIVSGMTILAVLTARVAFLACFVNYDYATEFLVYAHSGPAVKTVMHEVDRIAELTNEGYDMRIAYDDASSWPFTWYFRHYQNYSYIPKGTVTPSQLEGAKVVVVGTEHSAEVRQILGSRYYELDFIRLWWPMQEYFYLNARRVANVFDTDPNNVAARYYRQGMFDIWWSRDYSTYAQAMCIEEKQTRCQPDMSIPSKEDRDQTLRECQQALIQECAGDKRFFVNNWPVSDRMYVFVDKEVAAEVWDAGIGSATVDIREPQYPEDLVYRDRSAETVFGQNISLMGPRGAAVDAQGLVYIADTEHNQIMVLDPAGNLVRTIGTQPGGGPEPGSLKQPWGLDVGPDGYLYVADTWNHRVQVFTLTGDFVRQWGHEGIPSQDPSTDALWGPRDLKIGPDGNVYVADTGNKRIRVYTPTGEFVRDIGSPGSQLGQLDEPVGLAFNPVSGELYVAEAWNRRIQVFDQSGFPLRTWNVNMWFRNRESYNRPYIAVSPDGTLIYVTDMDDRHRIVAYNLNGVPVISFNQPDNLETNSLGLRAPAGLAVDPQGRLYVVDSELNKVFVFPPPDVVGDILPVPPVIVVPPPAATPEATEEPTGEVTSEVTEEPTSEVTPEATEEASVEVTPEVTEEPTSEVTPEATEEATIEATPEATESPVG